MTKRVFLFFVVAITAILGILLFYFYIYYQTNYSNIISPVKQENITKEKPLDKYAFEALKKQNFTGGEITFDKMLKEDPNFTSYLFFFTSSGKKVSGLVNLPEKTGKFPVIILFRGYVDNSIYTTGEGTRRTAEAFAKNGFISLAPDFLGYGKSASPSADSIEERFETYTTSLNLFASLKNLNQALSSLNGKNKIEADTDKIGLWGHSNGGQIAISILEITGGNYPTILWNPVSKPFPYSILYYTDEFEDHGRTLRKIVADFEKEYDAEKYSPTNYLDWINAPVQLHQAQNDEEVPQKWSDQLYNELRKLNKDVRYYTYPEENHNFNLGSWPVAISRSISFYREKL